MRQKIKHFLSSNQLLKIASLNSVSVFIRVISGLITSKLIAIFIGPDGLAFIGNFRDFIKSGQAFTTLGINNGVVKYVAELKNNSRELSQMLSTAFYLILFSVTFFSIGVYFTSESINDFIFTAQKDYVNIIKLIAISLPFYAFKTFIFSILNGLSKFKKILIINIIAQILGTIANVFLIWEFKLEGALISILLIEIILFVILLLSAFGVFNYLKLISFKKISFISFKSLGAFSIMALLSATLLPLVTVYVRNYIILEIGDIYAGFWVAMQRISNYYLMFVTTLITLYILPRFSQINTQRAFRAEVFSFYKTIIPIFGLGLIIIFFLRSFIVKLIFSDEFEPVTELFFWQILGDFIKVLSLVISYQFLAKKMLWHYIIIELLAIIVMYISSICLIDYYGLIGVVKAHFLSYLIHFIILLFVFRKALFGILPNNTTDDD
ncbi:O-antigen translocase [Psychroserpens ponticola]|uniref:O-antigen translocase n=1 Tax=Psychroserpens ponticola TaxID=2932268 RepID=A0ABY7RUN3_9FLAO|nr:O-antigen translocase [Psychroserpens ponticola]WCO00833.1 O-antigen translocase [Psychroserpens ponticola]